MRRIIQVQLLVFPLFVLFNSCQLHDKKETNETPVEVNDNVIKGLNLNRGEFVGLINDRIDAVSLEIITLTNEKSVQKAAIEMKKFFSKRLRKYSELEDSREAFLKSWALVSRFAEYIKKGDGDSLFGNQQETVRTAIAALLEECRQMAKKELSGKHFVTTETAIKNYVSENKIHGYFQEQLESTEFKFLEYLNLPFAPFKAVDTFNKSGDSIEDISKTVARFTDIAEELPEEIRWQLEVLSLQLERNGILKTNTESFAKLAETSEKLVKVIEVYPEQVSKRAGEISLELEARIKELTELSKKIDASMEKFERSSVNFKELGESVKETVEKVESSIKETKSSSDALALAATAVSEAVKNIHNFARSIEESSSKNENSKKNDDSFLIEVKKASEALEKSALQISAVLDKIAVMGERKILSNEADLLEEKAKKTLEMTRKESEELVDYIFWRLIFLIGIVFVLFLALIIFKRRKINCSKGN